MTAGRYNSYADYVFQNRELFPDVYREDEEPEEDIEESSEDTEE